MIGTLTYLAVNGHLVLIGALATSFKSLPIGGANIDQSLLWSMGLWGARIFETGLLVALPAVVALIIVNLALGVVTRAAPQLNLFGIGFTITLMSGFIVLIVGLDGLMTGISSLINSALSAVLDLVGSPPQPVH
jgi:flagellar biosynthetic protein FliR